VVSLDIALKQSCVNSNRSQRDSLVAVLCHNVSLSLSPPPLSGVHAYGIGPAFISVEPGIPCTLSHFITHVLRQPITWAKSGEELRQRRPA